MILNVFEHIWFDMRSTNHCFTQNKTRYIFKKGHTQDDGDIIKQINIATIDVRPFKHKP